MRNFIVLIVLVFISNISAYSQCAMCKATAESSGSGGGLNDGILYLMFIPYLLLGAFVIFVLRKKIVSFYKEFRKKDNNNNDLNPETWY